MDHSLIFFLSNGLPCLVHILLTAFAIFTSHRRRPCCCPVIPMIIDGFGTFLQTNHLATSLQHWWIFRLPPDGLGIFLYANSVAFNIDANQLPSNTDGMEISMYRWWPWCFPAIAKATIFFGKAMLTVQYLFLSLLRGTRILACP